MHRYRTGYINVDGRVMIERNSKMGCHLRKAWLQYRWVESGLYRHVRKIRNSTRPGKGGLFLGGPGFVSKGETARLHQQVGQPGPLPCADITDAQNKYAYVRNNPLRHTDPDGHCIGDICIGKGVPVYATATAAVTTAAYLMAWRSAKRRIITYGKANSVSYAC